MAEYKTASYDEVLKNIPLKLTVMSINNIKWSCLYSGMGILHTLSEKEIKKFEKLYDTKEHLQESLKDIAFLKCVYKKGKPVFETPPPEIINPGRYMWNFENFNKEINPSTQAYAILCILKYAELIYSSDKNFSFILLKYAKLIYNFTSTYLRNKDGLFISVQDKSKYISNDFIIKPIKDDEKLIDQILVFESFLKLSDITSNNNMKELKSSDSQKYIDNARSIYEYIASDNNILYKQSSKDLCLTISSFCRCCQFEKDENFIKEYINIIISLCAELECRIKITGEIDRDYDNYNPSSLMTTIKAASALMEAYKVSKISKFKELSLNISKLINDCYSPDLCLYVEPNSSKTGMSVKDIAEILAYLYMYYNISKEEYTLETIQSIYNMIFENYGIVQSVYEKSGSFNGVDYEFPDSISCMNENILPPVFMKSFRFSTGKSETITVSKNFSSSHALCASYIFLYYLSPFIFKTEYGVSNKKDNESNILKEIKQTKDEEGTNMTNINCSADCIHEENGKCKLNHVSITSNVMSSSTDCAYFSPRDEKVSSPPEKR